MRKVASTNQTLSQLHATSQQLTKLFDSVLIHFSRNNQNVSANLMLFLIVAFLEIQVWCFTGIKQPDYRLVELYLHIL